MANTKTTIRIRFPRWCAALLGIAVFAFAVGNLLMTLTSAADTTARVDAEFQEAQALPLAARVEAYRELRDEQAWALAQRPSDPYAWARLSYLRMATGDSMKSAFDALALSDFVSPYEAPQLPERAVMWYRFRTVETPEQQAYQDTLWLKAASLKGEEAWQQAVRNKLLDQAIASLQKTDMQLYYQWMDQKAHMH